MTATEPLVAWAEQALGQAVYPYQRRLIERAARLHHEGRARHPRPGQQGPFNCAMVGGPMDGQTITMQTFEPIIRANVAPAMTPYAVESPATPEEAYVPILIGEYHFNYRLQAWVWMGTT